jgi:ubiquinone/menaquinone biosynthesis C-methylase UbiE
LAGSVRVAAEADDGLELLSVDLLERHRPTVEQLRALAQRLGIGLGWHYLLDLAWAVDRLEAVPGATVLDAGAGTGVIQWYLADMGCTVISVDRVSRRGLPRRFRRRYRVRGLRPDDLAPQRPIGPAVALARSLGVAIRLWSIGQAVRRGYRPRFRRPTSAAAKSGRQAPGGEVVFYNKDLRQLDDIADESVDAIVSISALEHNQPSDLPDVVSELMRVLRPGGRLIATLGASAGADWFHAPSQGWCYSEATLRQAFSLPEQVSSNYALYDRLLAEVRSSSELRENLAPFYYRSGSNGMPWGKWDPQYLSVGVCTVKR